jgi:hypothetical protein
MGMAVWSALRLQNARQGRPSAGKVRPSVPIHQPRFLRPENQGKQARYPVFLTCHMSESAYLK